MVRCLFAAVILFASAQLLHGQQAADTIDRPTSEPYNGDLSIFEDPQRGEKLQIDRVMDLLAIKRGSRVADIGAGSGWFTVRAARRVGSDGLVYAVDINRDYIRHIKRRAAKEKLPNIRTIVGKPDDPLLRERSVDAVLLLKTYHEVAKPIALLRHVRAALRADGVVGIIDKNGTGGDHGLNAEVVINEAARVGFSLTAQYDFVKGDGMDYFLLFRADRSVAMRNNVARIRPPATNVPRNVPDTFDSPPVRQR